MMDDFDEEDYTGCTITCTSWVEEAYFSALLVDKVAKGGWGQIYLAQVKSGPAEGDFVAVKVITTGATFTLSRMDELLQRLFDVESSCLVALCGCPVVAQLLATSEVHKYGYSRYCLVLEWMPCGDAQMLLERSGRPLTCDAAGTILVSVLQALAAAHDLGYIHRDVKASNILLGMEGNVQLADWGICGVLRPPTDESESDAGGSAPPSPLRQRPSSGPSAPNGQPGAGRGARADSKPGEPGECGEPGGSGEPGEPGGHPAPALGLDQGQSSSCREAASSCEQAGPPLEKQLDPGQAVPGQAQREGEAGGGDEAQGSGGGAVEGGAAAEVLSHSGAARGSGAGSAAGGAVPAAGGSGSRRVAGDAGGPSCSPRGPQPAASGGSGLRMLGLKAHAGAPMGTPFWAAPELDAGLPHDMSVDIWSFGITFVELVTGRAPYYDTSPEGLQVLADPATGFVPDGLPKEIMDWLCRCLSVDPDARPSAHELMAHPFFVRMSQTVERHAAAVAAASQGGGDGGQAPEGGPMAQPPWLAFAQAGAEGFGAHGASGDGSTSSGWGALPLCGSAEPLIGRLSSGLYSAGPHSGDGEEHADYWQYEAVRNGHLTIPQRAPHPHPHLGPDYLGLNPHSDPGLNPQAPPPADPGAGGLPPGGGLDPP